MTHRKGLRNLRPAADAALLSDLRMTPELRQRVLNRIKWGEKPPRRRWSLARVGAAAVLVLAVALWAGSPAMEGPGEREESDRMRVPMPSAGMAVPAPMPAPAPAPIKQSMYALDPAQPTTAALDGEVQPGRKIIVNGDYRLRVEDARKAVDRLREITFNTGGYVSDASLDRQGDGSWYGRLTLRIPAGNVPDAVRELGTLGEVEHERQWTQDVTDQYIDLENRIAILREHEQTLRSLASRATSFDDWIRLTTQLNETRVQLENLTGSLKLLSNQVEYAILRVEVRQLPPDEAKLLNAPTNLGYQVWHAFVQSWLGVVRLARRAAIALAAMAPYLLVLAVPAALLIYLWRRRRMIE